MRKLSICVGLLGVLVLAAAIYGRFHAADTIMVHGHRFAAGTWLVLSNSILLVAIWLGVCGRKP